MSQEQGGPKLTERSFNIQYWKKGKASFTTATNRDPTKTNGEPGLCRIVKESVPVIPKYFSSVINVMRCEGLLEEFEGPEKCEHYQKFHIQFKIQHIHIRERQAEACHRLDHFYRL